MGARNFWSQVRQARLVRVLALYLASSWLLLQITSLFIESFDLPKWFMPAAVLLLLIGLVVTSATAWVQSHPSTSARTGADEIPGAWEIDLGELKDSVARGRLPHLTWARAILGGVVAFLLLFGLSGLYVLINDRGLSSSPKQAVAGTAAPGIAVLPFSVSSPRLDEWREGMVDLLSTNLDGAAGLRAIDSRTVMARWSERVQPGVRPDLETMLEVARRTGARYALVGSAVSLGNEVRLAADVYDLESGRPVGDAQREGIPDSILSLVDGLSVEVLEAILRGGAGQVPAPSLARVTTTSLPALKAYLEGEAAYRRSDFDRAIPAYARAVEADSSFALAYFRMGSVYGWVATGTGDETVEYLQRAARLSDRLTLRDALLVRATLAYNRLTVDLLEELREATRIYPEDAEVWYRLGETYWHVGQTTLNDAQEQADRAFARALELDPSFTPAYIHRLDKAFEDADSARAEQLVRKYDTLAPESPRTRGSRLAFALAFGDSAARRKSLAALDTIPPAVLAQAAEWLFAPRSLQAQEMVLARAGGRTAPTAGIALLRVVNHFNRGRIRAALEALDDPLTPKGFREHILYLLHEEGFPVPADRLERELAVAKEEPRSGGDPAFTALYAGLYAVDRARRQAEARALAKLKDDAQRFLSQGDSANAQFSTAAARAVDAYALIATGRRDEGLRLLENASARVGGGGRAFDAGRVVRWLLAKRLLEEGRAREAERYFLSFHFFDPPYAQCYLGKIYEELGEPGKARPAYENCALALKDADPELQLRVQEARAALQRLTSVIKE